MYHFHIEMIKMINWEVVWNFWFDFCITQPWGSFVSYRSWQLLSTKGMFTMSSFFTLLFILSSALHKIYKCVLQTPCYCVGLPTLAFHRRYQYRHLACLSAVRLVESELRSKVTMIMSTFSSCPIAKTSSTASLLEDQEWRMFFVLQDILVLNRSVPPTCGTHTLTRGPPMSVQDVRVIYRIVPVFCSARYFGSVPVRVSNLRRTYTHSRSTDECPRYTE